MDLGHFFTILEPTVEPKMIASDSPHIIVLCSWMDASAKHISKYTLYYQKLYPQAMILTITSSYLDFIYRPRSYQKKKLLQLIPLLANKLNQGRLHVHIFSNGGALSLLNLGELFLEETGMQLPIHCLVLDSSPGRASLQQGSTALFESFPKKWYIRFLMIAFIYPFLFAIWLYVSLCPPNVLDLAREGLNNPNIIALTTRRLYLFSTTDKICHFLDVEDHIRDAVSKGYLIEAVRWENSCHVGHMRQNNEAYWKAVRNCWDIAEGFQSRM